MTEQSGEHVHYWDDGRCPREVIIDGQRVAGVTYYMTSMLAPRLSWTTRSSPPMARMSTSILYRVKLLC